MSSHSKALATRFTSGASFLAAPVPACALCGPGRRIAMLKQTGVQAGRTAVRDRPNCRPSALAGKFQLPTFVSPQKITPGTS